MTFEKEYLTKQVDLKMCQLFINFHNNDWLLYHILKTDLDIINNSNLSKYSLDLIKNMKENYKLIEKNRINTFIEVINCDYNIMMAYENLNRLQELCPFLRQKIEPTNKTIIIKKNLDEIKDYLPGILDENLIESKTLLNNINEIIENNKIAIIHGIGGLGKSTLVRQFIRLNEINNKYTKIWFDAKSEESIKNTFKLILENDLNIQEKEDNLIEKFYSEIAKRTDKHFLFIFDNLNDLNENIQNIIAKFQKNIRCIITTRNEDIKKRNIFEELQSFYGYDENDVRNLIKKEINGLEEDELEKVTKSIMKNQEYSIGLRIDISVKLVKNNIRKFNEIIDKIRNKTNKDLIEYITDKLII
jgi:energy-coupling factor transporter ATP-binding protein EcfA2